MKSDAVDAAKLGLQLSFGPLILSFSRVSRC